MQNGGNIVTVGSLKSSVAIKIYLPISFVSVFYFAWVLFRVSQHDGWGEWAAGTAFIYPVILSAVLCIVGLSLWLWRIKSKSSSKLIGWASLLASSPFLWFVGKIIQRSLFSGDS
jgi:hypothetical protein